MFKNFLMRKMLEAKMKDVPKDQQEKILSVIEKNPDFFTKIAAKVDERVKQGQDQMAATMEVMKEHQEELKKLL